MIHGDPYEFAIWFDVLEKYANKNFREGVFHIFIDGNLFPSHAYAMPVNYQIAEIVGNFNRAGKSPINFSLETAEQLF